MVEKVKQARKRGLFDRCEIVNQGNEGTTITLYPDKSAITRLTPVRDERI